MGSHGLPRPHRANFTRRVVANGENEIHSRRIRLRKFVPTLAAKAIRRGTGKFDLFQRLRAYEPRRMTARAIGHEIGRTLTVEYGFRHDGARRIPRAQKYNVLFLCTGNSARSIMAEAILNRKGPPNFMAYSAGSHPSGLVRAEALKQIELSRASTNGLRSKSWDEFAKPDAPRMDFVFTVCDNAASEVCPVWPGQPMTAHRGIPDHAAVTGSPEQIERAFRDTFMILERRITLFLSLPLSTLGQLAIQREIDRVGQQ